LRAEATITRKDNGALHLRLLVRSGSLAGERNIDGKSCPGLVGAAAVTLVLLLHSSEPLTEDGLAGSTSLDAGTSGSSPPNATKAAPNAATNAEDNAKASTKDAALPSAPPSTASDEQRASAGSSDSATQTSGRWHALLQVPQLQLGLGPLHQPSLGLAIAAGASFAHFRFLARGSVWFPQHASAGSGEQQYGADIDRFSATLLTCRAFPVSWVELSPCLSFALERASARGTGAHVGARTAKATWFAAGVGAQARAPIAPWFSLFLGIDGQLQISQPTFSVDEIGTIEQLLPVAFTTTVGSEWIF